MGQREEGRTRRALRYPRVASLRSFPPEIVRPVKSHRFPVFLLHATSSRSNSLPRPSPRLRLLCSFSLSFSCPLFTSVPLSSELVSVSDPHEQKSVASRGKPRERGPRIDLMRIIPALIAWNGTSSACPASSPASWLVDSLSD